MYDILYRSVKFSNGFSSKKIVDNNVLTCFNYTNNLDSFPKEPPNSGYGWIVVIASFFIHVFVLGNIYSFGVLFPVYMKAFNASQGSVAWVGSIGAGLMTGMAAYSGTYADQYGNGIIVFFGGILISLGLFLASYSTELWHLYVTQGFITGIGYSLAFISGVSVVGQWFTTKRGLATGIAVAGSGLGQFGISLSTGALLLHFNWRMTLRCLALIDFFGLIICSLFIRRCIPCYTRNSKESGFIFFKDRNFVLLYFSGFFCLLGLFMPYTHLPKYAQLHGISVQNSIIMLSIMGIASALGRVLIGFAADIYGKLVMLKICMIVGGISTLCWLGSGTCIVVAIQLLYTCVSFITLTIYGFAFGFFAGGVISLMPTVCAELYGIKKLGIVVGMLYTGTALGNLLSAPIGGFLYDGTGDYTVSIIVAACFMLFGSIFVFFVDANHKLMKIYIDCNGDMIDNTSNYLIGNTTSTSTNNTDKQAISDDIELNYDVIDEKIQKDNDINSDIVKDIIIARDID